MDEVSVTLLQSVVMEGVFLNPLMILAFELGSVAYVFGLCF